MSVEKLIKEKQLYSEKSTVSNDVDESLDLIERKLREFKATIINHTRNRLIEKYTVGEINEKNNFDVIKKDAWYIIEEEIELMEDGIYFDSSDKADILEMLIQNMFGYGVLQSLIMNPEITEIMVNGKDKIFIEKNGQIVRAKNEKDEFIQFNTNEDLLFVIEKIVAPINRKVDESNPIVDARLPNGFRVNIVLNVVSLDGTVITIRKFPETPFTMKDLIKFGALTDEVAHFIKRMVEAKYNMIISGGTGSGKTTFLNVVSNYIERDSRIITIEDSAELKISKIDNLIRMETRPANIEGKGQITIRELVRSALRMRPDRIIVGEVRGGEALDMLQAMNTGHDGSLSTGHANSSQDMLTRLETMVLMAGVDLPLISIRQQIASAVEFIIHLGKLKTGKRKVLQVIEVVSANENGYIINEIFRLMKDGKSNEEKLFYTGNKITRKNKLIFLGDEAQDVDYLINEND